MYIVMKNFETKHGVRHSFARDLHDPPGLSTMHGAAIAVLHKTPLFVIWPAQQFVCQQTNRGVACFRQYGRRGSLSSMRLRAIL